MAPKNKWLTNGPCTYHYHSVPMDTWSKSRLLATGVYLWWMQCPGIMWSLLHSWLLTSKVNEGSRVVVKLGATHLTITSLNDGSPSPNCADKLRMTCICFLGLAGNIRMRCHMTPNCFQRPVIHLRECWVNPSNWGCEELCLPHLS